MEEKLPKQIELDWNSNYEIVSPIFIRQNNTSLAVQTMLAPATRHV